LHDFTFAETPSAAKFSAGYGTLLYQFVNRPRVDLEQVRHLRRGENFFHRYISSFDSSGLLRFSQSAVTLPANLRFGIKRKNFNAEYF